MSSSQRTSRDRAKAIDITIRWSFALFYFYTRPSSVWSLWPIETLECTMSRLPFTFLFSFGFGNSKKVTRSPLVLDYVWRRWGPVSCRVFGLHTVVTAPWIDPFFFLLFPSYHFQQISNFIVYSLSIASFFFQRLNMGFGNLQSYRSTLISLCAERVCAAAASSRGGTHGSSYRNNHHLTSRSAAPHYEGEMDRAIKEEEQHHTFS